MSARARTAHSARDERRIDVLQELATSELGRGAAVSVDRTREGHRVVVFDAKGDEQITIVDDDKSRALALAIDRCRAWDGNRYARLHPIVNPVIITSRSST